MKHILDKYFETTCYRVIVLVFCRLIMLAECLLLFYFAYCANFGSLLYVAMLAFLTILIETIYLSIVNGGRDFHWFSFSYIVFSFYIIMICWRTTSYEFYDDASSCLKNYTLMISNSSTVITSCLNIRLNMCQWTYAIISILLITLIYVKLRTPISKRNTVKQHSNLLAILLASAADVIDFFEYSNETHVIRFVNLHTIYGEINSFSFS